MFHRTFAFGKGRNLLVILVDVVAGIVRECVVDRSRHLDFQAVGRERHCAENLVMILDGRLDAGREHIELRGQARYALVEPLNGSGVRIGALLRVLGSEEGFICYLAYSLEPAVVISEHRMLRSEHCVGSAVAHKAEHVAVWTFETERYKTVDNKSFITTPFQTIIKSIKLVQENQRLYKGQEQIYDIWLTRGIIFDFGDHQISFEKAVWFSEDIYIQKGYDLVDGFASVENFIKSDWSEGIKAECTRQVEIL